MRLIDKLVLMELVGPFLNGLAMFLMLLFAATYLFPATELLVKGVSILKVLQLILFNVPSLLTQTFPMAMLLASLLGVGRISADSEAVALFAAGVSFPRIARSVIVMGCIVSVVAYFWNDLVVPPASSVAMRLRRDIQRSVFSENKTFAYPITNTKGDTQEFVRIDGGVNLKTKTLRRVTIIKYSQEPSRQGQPEAIIYCDQAVFRDQMGLDGVYYNGYLILYGSGTDNHSVDNSLVNNFTELRSLPRGASIGKTFEEILSSSSSDPNSKSFTALRREIMKERSKGVDTSGKECDLYGKLALPLASLIFGVVGAALGMNTRRSSGKAVGFGMAIFIVFLYWVFYHSMFVAGNSGALPPALASFLPDIVGGVVGAVLMVRASR